MAISPDKIVELNLEQKVAVAKTRYLRGKRGELLVGDLSEAPAGLDEDQTAFEPDSLGGIRRILLQEKGSWREVYLFGPIKNRDRELISGYFGLNETLEQRVLTHHIGSMSFQRKYLVTTNKKGGVEYER